MGSLSPEIASEVVVACQANASEAAGAFQRALGLEGTLWVGEAATADPKSLAADLTGPGLLVVFQVGDQGALAAIPSGEGGLPAWCQSPDATGQSKLATLAQELGMLLLPEQLMPSDSQVRYVSDLPAQLARAGLPEAATTVPMELRGADGRTLAVRLIWPATQPEATLQPAGEPGQAGGRSTGLGGEAQGAPSGGTGATESATPAPPLGLHQLPAYTRSLLRIKVPAAVLLAQKRQPIGRIVELGPGSIIQFDKSCEEMLELDVGGLSVALGEAVKVGDKFGLRIASIVLPGERFQKVVPGRRN